MVKHYISTTSSGHLWSPQVALCECALTITMHLSLHESQIKWNNSQSSVYLHFTLAKMKEWRKRWRLEDLKIKTKADMIWMNYSRLPIIWSFVLSKPINYSNFWIIRTKSVLSKPYLRTIVFVYFVHKVFGTLASGTLHTCNFFFLSKILLKVKRNSLKNCEKFSWKLCNILLNIESNFQELSEIFFKIK